MTENYIDDEYTADVDDIDDVFDKFSILENSFNSEKMNTEKNIKKINETIINNKDELIEGINIVSEEIERLHLQYSDAFLEQSKDIEVINTRVKTLIYASLGIFTIKTIVCFFSFSKNFKK